MSGFDLILVTIFLIIVIYVVRRAIDEIDDRTKITWNEKDIKEQLSKKTLGDTPLDQIVEISFKVKPSDRFTFDYGDKSNPNGKQPQSIDIVVKNKSEQVLVAVDWDKSTLTDFGDPTRRVIVLDGSKKIPSLAPPGSQTPTAVTPKTTLTASITAVSLLGFDSDKLALEPKKPIVDLKALYDASKKKGSDRNQKLVDMQEAFINRKKPLEFTLSVMLRLTDLAEADTRDYLYRVRCHFQVAYMPWHEQLPWLPNL